MSRTTSNLLALLIAVLWSEGCTLYDHHRKLESLDGRVEADRYMDRSDIRRLKEVVFLPHPPDLP